MEVLMQRVKLLSLAVIFLVTSLALLSAGCFSSNASKGSATNVTANVVKPQPQVESVIATTSGTQSAYYATLDIKVKNTGAEGTILVKAGITQNGKSSLNEMPVFLKQNETHELKLTFPLVWQGGEFTSNVTTVIP
jgi:hypothetical protein